MKMLRQPGCDSRHFTFVPKHTQFQTLQAEGDADDGYHQYQSCDEILQGYVQAPEYDPDDVS